MSAPRCRRMSTVPIFGRGYVPGGRLQDVAAALGPAVAARVAWIPAPGFDNRWDCVLYLFPSVEALDAELTRDGGRCPANMGGDAKGWRKLVRAP